MPWDRSQKGYHQFTIKEKDPTSIQAGMVEFWKLFAANTISEVDPSTWDYLIINVRGIDEGFGVYPQKLDRPPFMVSWATLSVHQMGYEYREAVALCEDDLRASEVCVPYARLMIEAARIADLAKLIGRSEPVLLRFVSHADESNPPLLEEYVLFRDQRGNIS
jgi:hypothetical protein